MAFTKLTSDLNYIQALSDTPNETDGLTADQLKEKFDKAGNANKTAFNGLIDELEATTGAASLGAAAMGETDLTTGNVQAKLNALYSVALSIKAGGLTDGSIATAKLANNAVTSIKLASGAVDRGNIANGAVTDGKIASNAVMTAKIADGAVTSAKLATAAKKAENLTATAMTEEDESDGNIQAKLNKLASDMTSISQGGVADGAVTTSKIADVAVTTAKLKNLNVTTAKINDGAVTEGKIANNAVSTSKIASGFGLIPQGGIIMWSGVNVPTGWYLCDGQNGTPDLRNRFIVGAGDEYSIGNTGGEKSHTLSISEMPSHNHNLEYEVPKSGSSSYTLETLGAIDGLTGSTVANVVKYADTTSRWGGRETVSYDSILTNTGSGEAFENRPPYYALAFIMKA